MSSRTMQYEATMNNPESDNQDSGLAALNGTTNEGLGQIRNILLGDMNLCGRQERALRVEHARRR